MDNRILIESIQIKNFRSIRNLKLQSSNFNIFVGLNDAGKSNFLKALNLFFNEQTDYNKPFDFLTDFSYLFPKNSHNTKEIKITIKFAIPNGYKDSGIYTWDKVWRTDGYKTERIVNEAGEEPTPRSRIPGALKRIRYRYVPAVKSKDYYKSLLAELYLTVSASLKSPLKQSTQDFSNVLKDYTKYISTEAFSRLHINSELSIPDNLSDIFKALVFRTKTEYDGLDIALDYRGDGIQARHIPIILKYIADEDQNSRNRGSTKVCTIWGFEEPENGVELSKAFEMADEFSEYSNSIQLFITTHSPAFYMKKADESTSIYFATKKEGNEGTIFQPEKNSKILGENMGLMPLIAPFVAEKVAEIREINKAAANSVTTDVNTILVEGVTDKKYIEAAIKRYSIKLQEQLDANVLRVFTKIGAGGTSNMVSFAKSWIYSGNKSRLFLLLDKDKAAIKAKADLEESAEYKGKTGSVLINIQHLVPSNEFKSLFSKKVSLYYEIEHLLSIEFWKKLIDLEYTEQRGSEELYESFGSLGDINKPITTTIAELIDNQDVVNTIVMNNPNGDKKIQISNLALKELEDNPETDIFEGFIPTIKKLEKVFSKD